MFDGHNGPAGQVPAAVGKSAALGKAAQSDVTRVLTAVLLTVVFIGAIVGGIVAFTSGMPALAFAIALVTGAFFARVGC